MNDTIAAVATAHGIASIAIVRLSGSLSLDIAKRLTHSISFEPRYANLRTLYDSNEETIDQAIVLYFQAPKSFTGEDIVEFQCHGGIVVAERILEEVCRLGARLALPGEFSKRAFLNGKIDLSEAEAIAKIIEAKSVDAAKILAKQLKGELRAFVDAHRDALLEILAYTEVTIDYAEEDLPETIYTQIFAKLSQLKSQLQETVEASRRRAGLIEGYKVAIIGKPNVGKSSLLNALLRYERAIVSDVAGTTRDTIEEAIRIGTHLIRIVDTAGVRQADNEIERIGIAKTLESIEEADVVIALFDGSRAWDEEDEQIVKLLDRLEPSQMIVAINKSDLPRVLDGEKLNAFDPIEVSAKREFSRLTHRLEALLDKLSHGDDILLVSRRQIEAVTQAVMQIEESERLLQEGALEFFAYHIQEAIKALSSITKPYDNEEILDKMFSEFCLGK